MAINYKELIEEFISKLDQITILTKCFNEKSLQHELGQFLQKRLGEKFLVQYERNAKYFQCTNNSKYFTNRGGKKELDIVIIKNTDKPEKLPSSEPECSIELKFQKLYKDDLSSTIASPTGVFFEHLKDIELIEQCKESGFKNAFSLFLSDHPFCYCKNRRSNKYPVLHATYKEDKEISPATLERINEEIQKNGKWRTLTIKGKYKLKWIDLLSYKDEKGNELNLKYILEEGK